MNKQQAKELLPIIQAFVEGKTIEFRNKSFKEWTEIENPSFDPTITNYRIKPEPKYRPFANAKECWQEMQKHQPFGWFIEKTKDGEPKERFMLTCVSDSHPEIKTNEYLFKDCTFEDGSICGVLVEE